MKKINPLLVVMMGLISMTAFAQQPTPGSFELIDLGPRPNKANFEDRMIKVGEVPTESQSSRANVSFFIDYDSLSNNDALGGWRFNKNLNQNNDMNYAIVSFDSLIDLAGTGYNYDDHYVTIDSVDLFFTHQNRSGQTNSIILSLLEVNQDTNIWTNAAVFSDTITTTTSLTKSLHSIGGIRFRPNFAMCTGRYAVRIEYDAPAQDTMLLVYGYNEGACATQMCSMGAQPGALGVSPFYPSSFYGIWNGVANPTYLQVPSTTFGDFFIDCNGDNGFTPNNCESWVIQNFWIFSHVSIQDVAPAPLVLTTSSTPDDGTGNGTAAVSVTGGLGDYSITWSTTPPQTGPIATGLAAGTYNVTVTYGQNCDVGFEMVTVGSNVSIDDLDAGVSSLKAFPNPTEGQFELNFELEKNDDVAVKLYDLTGKLIYTQEINNVRLYNNSINLENAANGVYLLRIETSLGTATRRIVKQ